MEGWNGKTDWNGSNDQKEGKRTEWNWGSGGWQVLGWGGGSWAAEEEDCPSLVSGQ